MSFSAIAGVFLKLPRLFLRICRWVLARMALHCKASGLNGGFPMSSTAKERPRGTNSWKWRRMLLVLGVATGVVWAIWVFFEWNGSSFSRKDNIIDAWREKAQVLSQHFNVSKDEVDALTSFYSKSDQACVLGPYNFSISSPQFLILHRPTQVLLAQSISRKPIKNSAYGKIPASLFIECRRKFQQNKISLSLLGLGRPERLEIGAVYGFRHYFRLKGIEFLLRCSIIFPSGTQAAHKSQQILTYVLGGLVSSYWL